MYINMKKLIYVFAIGVLMCMGSCEKDVIPVLGSVTADEVESTTISCCCEVIDGSINACGFYYDTKKNYVSGKKADKIEGVFNGNTISAKLTQLAPNKIYYIMAYGVNELGEGYSTITSVKTAHRVPGVGDNKYPDVTE